MKNLKEQYKILKKYFPEHKFKDIKLPELPEQAEDWYLIPVIKGTYKESLQKVLDAIKDTRYFTNYNDIEKISSYKNTNISSLPKAGDFYVYPAQMGKKWKGKSVEYVRENLGKNEFGLNSYEVGCILLTHPEILQKYEDLWIDCPEDNYAGGDFSLAPIFCFSDGEVEFVAYTVDYYNGSYGSASGFLPQYPVNALNLESLNDFCECERCKNCGKIIKTNLNNIESV